MYDIIITKFTKDGNEVGFYVEPEYVGKSFRPTRFHVEYTVDDKTTVEKYISNWGNK